MYVFSFRGARQPDRLLSVLRSFIHRHRRASVFWHRWVRPIAALAPLRLGFGSIEGRRTCTFSRSLLVPRGPQRWGRDRSSALVSLKGVRYDGVKDSEVRENRILLKSETTTGIDVGHHYEWSPHLKNNGEVPPLSFFRNWRRAPLRVESDEQQRGCPLVLSFWCGDGSNEIVKAYSGAIVWVYGPVPAAYLPDYLYLE